MKIQFPDISFPKYNGVLYIPLWDKQKEIWTEIMKYAEKMAYDSFFQSSLNKKAYKVTGICYLKTIDEQRSVDSKINALINLKKTCELLELTKNNGYGI